MTPGTGEIDQLMEAVKFDEKGLAVAIVQDAETGQVLMCAFVNRAALERTFETGKMHYWSRSRQKLWLKGESSGHEQGVREVRIDCDGDALLFKVDQIGGACHKGFRSCFYRRRLEGRWQEDGERVFDPDKVY